MYRTSREIHFLIGLTLIVQERFRCKYANGSFRLTEMDSGTDSDFGIPNPMATLYQAEHVHFAQTWTQIAIPYFCTGQESESESVPESVYGNINEPLLFVGHSRPVANDDQI